MKKLLFAVGILVALGLLFTAGWLVIGTFGPEPSIPETTVTTAPTTETTVPVQTTEETTQATTLPEQTIPEETTAPVEQNPFELDSHHAFVYDLTNDEMLYQMGGTYDRVYPASLTKLFTALVVLEHMDTEDTVTAGDELALLDPDSTMAYIYRGQTLTVAECVKGMLMQSGNDAAYILAVACGRVLADDPELSYTEALALFIEEMNRSAHMAGLYDTHFCTPDGIHAEDHYTTVADLTTFCRLALANPVIRDACATVSYEAVYITGQKATWNNTNAQLHKDSEFYNEYAVGLKTGTTSAAGACLLSAYDCGDRMLIIGVLGAEEKPSRYTDTKKLFDAFALPEMNLPAA